MGQEPANSVASTGAADCEPAQVETGAIAGRARTGKGTPGGATRMSQREYKIEKTYTAVRYEGDKQQGPSIRFEVAPDCFVTVFDDGHVRFVVKPKEGRGVVHWENTSSDPGARVMETRLRASGE